MWEVNNIFVNKGKQMCPAIWTSLNKSGTTFPSARSFYFNSSAILGGPIGWCQNCHTSKMSATPKQGKKTTFIVLLPYAWHTPKTMCFALYGYGGGGSRLTVKTHIYPSL